MNANAAHHFLNSVRTSVESRPVKPVPASIDLTRAVDEFCGQDATKSDRLMAIGSKIAGAACLAGIGHRLYADDFALLKRFVEHVEGDFALWDFLVPDDKPDTQHSPDESHFLDQERR